MNFLITQCNGRKHLYVPTKNRLDPPNRFDTTLVCSNGHTPTQSHTEIYHLTRRRRLIANSHRPTQRSSTASCVIHVRVGRCELAIRSSAVGRMRGAAGQLLQQVTVERVQNIDDERRNSVTRTQIDDPDVRRCSRTTEKIVEYEIRI